MKKGRYSKHGLDSRFYIGQDKGQIGTLTFLQQLNITTRFRDDTGGRAYLEGGSDSVELTDAVHNFDRLAVWVVAHGERARERATECAQLFV